MTKIKNKCRIMGNADDKVDNIENNVINLAEHRWKVDKSSEDILDFKEEFSGRVLDVVKVCDKPDGDWIPFSALIKTIMAWRMNPEKMADELSKLRDEKREIETETIKPKDELSEIRNNEQEKQEIFNDDKFDKAA